MAFDFDCDWYCDECGAFLNSQPGFNCYSGTWVCTKCGSVNDVSEDNIIDDDDNDYSERSVYSDEIPEGCRACGGPYPNCIDSCSLMDD